MNTTREFAVDDDDDDAPVFALEEGRAAELIEAVKKWHRARHCTNPDVRLQERTEADLLATCRWYFEHG